MIKKLRFRLSDLSLFLCYCLLVGGGSIVSRYWSGNSIALFMTEVICFALPTLLHAVDRSQRQLMQQRMLPKKMPRGAVGLIIQLGLTAAVLSLFLNLLIYQLLGMTGADLGATVLTAPQDGLSTIGKIVIVVIASSVVEEIYFRNALISAHEQSAGTVVCIVLNGVFFAMLHSNLLNFAGPMVAGMLYAYLTVSFGSVWPAILAHIVNNLYYLFVVWITNTYAAYGIWNYFAALNALLLLAMLYFSLKTIERMMKKGSLRSFQKGRGIRDYRAILTNPGTIIFLIAFLVKAILGWI